MYPQHTCSSNREGPIQFSVVHVVLKSKEVQTNAHGLTSEIRHEVQSLKVQHDNAGLA